MKMSRIAGYALAGLCTLYAFDAFASDTVAVMKLDALGDVDNTASQVLESVRSYVMDRDDLILDVNGGDITYTEMQMVTGCDREASIGCYEAACESLGAPAIIFGSVKDGGETHLVWYVSGKGVFREVTGVVNDKVAADKLASDLVIGAKGSLVVTSNVPGADVFIDGKRVGMAYEFEENAQPLELVSGNYVIAVRKDGYEKEDAKLITVKAGETSRIHVDMVVAQDPEEIARAVRISGYSSMGVGVAGLVVAGVMLSLNKDKGAEINKFIEHGSGKDVAAEKRDNDRKALSGKYDDAKLYEGLSIGFWIGGGFFLAAGVALTLTGHLYDFVGDEPVANANSFIPKIDVNLSSDYKGMNFGWTF